jgi:hypothetical protein
MQELAKVKGFDAETGDERWFHLPTSDANESWLRKYYVKVPYEYEGSRDEAKYYVREYLTDDEELPKLVDLPSNLCELNEFLTRWSELDKSQKQTTVALVEYEFEPLEALELAEEETATIIDTGIWFSDEARDRAVGEFYLEYLLDMEYFGKVPEFFRSYFDAEAFGRDLRLHGGDGFWSGIYNRWVDYPQGGYENRLWYFWRNR